MHRFRQSICFSLAALVSVMVGGGARADASKYDVAVIIGNTSYQHAPDVKYAGNDADLAKTYAREVLDIREGNVLDVRDAGLTKLRTVFGSAADAKGDLYWTVKPGESEVFVFYSGHGVPHVGDNGARGYLLPVDARPGKPTLGGYPLDQLYANLKELPAKRVTAMLDACFSGLSQAGNLIPRTSGSFGVGVAAPKPQAKLALLTATAFDEPQYAHWLPEEGHGAFSYYAFKGLYGAADTDQYGARDGTVRLTEVHAYLGDEMRYRVRRTYQRDQSPSLRAAEGMDLALSNFSEPGAGPEPPFAADADGSGTSDNAAETQTASKPTRENAGPEEDANDGPDYTVETRDEPFVVTTASNVRAGPGTDHDRLTTLDTGTEITVTGKVEGKDWYRIAHADGSAGFIFGKLIVSRSKYAARTDTGGEETASDAPSSDERSSAGGGSPLSVADLEPGDTFRDCAGGRVASVDDAPPDVFCGPEMVVVPPGEFRMGDLSGGYWSDERPVHRVEIEERFAAGVHEVTRAQFRAFVEATGYDAGEACHTYENDEWTERDGRTWRDPSYDQGERHPVVCVSWKAKRAYVDWLSEKTGAYYRLLTEAEWEYVARAGITNPFWFGWEADSGCHAMNAADATAGLDNPGWPGVSCSDGYAFTAPVGSFAANPFGLYDVHGNVYEWTRDCWHDSYEGAPRDGSAWGSEDGGDCSRRVLRGGSWNDGPANLRSANRDDFDVGDRYYYTGFRVARTF